MEEGGDLGTAGGCACCCEASGPNGAIGAGGDGKEAQEAKENAARHWSRESAKRIGCGVERTACDSAITNEPQPPPATCSACTSDAV